MDQDRPTKKLPSTAVAKRYGVTRRSLARWMADEELGFPQPIAIAGRFYFDEADLDTFDAACAKRQAEARGRAKHLHPAKTAEAV